MRLLLKLQKRSELWRFTAQRWQEGENGVELGWHLCADSSEGVLKILLISVHGMRVFRPQLSPALERRVRYATENALRAKAPNTACCAAVPQRLREKNVFALPTR